MIIVSWNCRGLGNTSAIRDLRALVRSASPDCIILQETKIATEPLRVRLFNLGFQNLVHVPPVGLAGGLGIAWSDNVELEPIVVRKNVISCLVFPAQNSPPWLLSGIYGPCYRAAKLEFWDSFPTAASRFNGAWLVLGDFNGILLRRERSSNRGIDSASVAMRDALDNIGMIDIPSSGSKFSFCNNRLAFDMVRSKLDRGMRPFRFEPIWVEDPRSHLVVQHSWLSRQHHQPPVQFLQRQAVTRTALWQWNHHQFGKVQTIIKHTREAISAILDQPVTNERVAREADLRLTLDAYLKHEETLWLNKSKLKWRREGDRCTKFFFMTTLLRRKRNRIDAVKDDNGVWLQSRDQIGRAFLAKFQCIYSEDTTPSDLDLNQWVNNSISEEQNVRLVAIPDHEEIRRVVFNMGNFKAPGPDGMTSLFYKSYWQTVGGDVIALVQDFFRSNRLLPELNYSNIVLIPKTDKPTSMNHYRPISVCNLVYKVIAKLLADRIKPLLQDLICPTQGAFVSGRSIHDNSVIIQEVIHSMKKKSGQVGYVAMKIDLQKAYDRLNWEFLFAVLKAFGFHDRWIGWVRSCVSSVSMNLLLNGSVFGSFRPKRGLRQGDPLSPYLFILCMEVLSRLISHKVDRGLIRGLKVSRATTFECSQFKECLDIFCNWSGQSFNVQKSNIFFSKNTRSAVASALTHLLGFSRISLQSHYLGLPLFRSNRVKDFSYLLDRLDSNLAGWKMKLLSRASKLILIKSVGLALPIYSMQSTCLPRSICSKMDSKVRQFWWGSRSDSSRALCLRSWSAICAPKALGGLEHLEDSSAYSTKTDRWVWTFTKNGNFSAKSAYLADQQQRFLNLSTLPRDVWLRIWNSRILPRHKLLWWQLLNDCFPTRLRLNRLFSISDLSCVICNSADENIIHLLFHCDFSRRLWLASPWTIHPNPRSFSSAADCVRFIWRCDEIAGNHNEDIWLFASILLDSIWRIRNSSFTATMNALKPNSLPRVSTWSPPLEGWTKINFDAATCPSFSVAAAVVRDWRGKVIKWQVRELLTSDPLEAEAAALEVAISLAIQESLTNVVFEGDSKLVIDNLVDSSLTDLWQVSVCLDNYRFSLQSIPCWSAVFVPRSCNFCAHNLARWGLGRICNNLVLNCDPPASLFCVCETSGG
ncbi:hypothetical protein UlMin_011394 [Ulmus minor]